MILCSDPFCNSIFELQTGQNFQVVPVKSIYSKKLVLTFVKLLGIDSSNIYLGYWW